MTTLPTLFSNHYEDQVSQQIHQFASAKLSYSVWTIWSKIPDLKHLEQPVSLDIDSCNMGLKQHLLRVS